MIWASGEIGFYRPGTFLRRRYAVSLSRKVRGRPDDPLYVKVRGQKGHYTRKEGGGYFPPHNEKGGMKRE